MPDHAIVDLLRLSPLSIVGTVEHLGSSTMDVPVDERTGVVFVDRVLHAPDTLWGLEGQRVTLQFAPAIAPPKERDTAAFFVDVLALGASVALAEIGRLPLETVAPYLRRAAETSTRPFSALEHQLQTDSICKHADDAAAVVLGRVVKLEAAPRPGSGISEHDPDWWIATLAVHHIERGDVPPGDVRVRYANSRDVQWRAAPKPTASESGLWLLHRTEGEYTDDAPFEILHAEDRQPVQTLDAIREYRR